MFKGFIPAAEIPTSWEVMTDLEKIICLCLDKSYHEAIELLDEAKKVLGDNSIVTNQLLSGLYQHHLRSLPEDHSKNE